MTLEDNQPIQLVFLSDGVERESVIAIPYEYSLSTRGKWEMIIANENKNKTNHYSKKYNNSALCF